jgi:hypothetical protein
MDRIDELERLEQLRTSGTLTEDEFTREKARLLKGTDDGRSRALVTSGVVLAIVAIVAAFMLGRSPLSNPSAPVSTGPSAANDSPAGALPPVQPAPVVAQAAAGKLQQIFRADMLGAQLAYLEGMVGPARNVEGNNRTYLVDGCQVIVRADGKAIRSIGLSPISSRCNVSLKDFGLDAMTDRITFGMVEQIGISGETQYGADCLSSCGNAYDPNVYSWVRTPHVLNFIEFRPAATVNSEAMKWADAMRAARGEDYVTSTRFNCDQTFNPLASKLLRNVRIESIEVGHFDPPMC